MAIKVIANWPWDDPEAMQQLREGQARATLIALRKLFADRGLGENSLDILMKKIENER
ncbi:hypothetical protein ACJDU8_03055 [Clostridium sp. WILCCON 0269]|uniref:Uncharacterized protein n=1 Tax=Candidatus Clostridium eludens TaxID=3381663 RepID=A0ABW8SEU3_9CLOT